MAHQDRSVRGISARVATAVVGVVSVLGTLIVAGPLDPPVGPIAPTYKTLAEVEPRIAINATNTPGNSSSVFVLSQPGSYYLTSNISAPSGRSGITIIASGVTLDLNGFAITGSSGSLHGVSVGALLRRITVRNGLISTFGIHGITAPSAGAFVVEGVTVESCGGNGFDLGDGASIDRCTARANASNGIRLGASSAATNCISVGNATGIELNSSSTVADCTISGNTSRGILAGGSDGVVRDNTIATSGANAFGVTISGSRVTLRDNVITGNPGTTGLSVSGTNNIIAGNIVRGFSVNYSLGAGPNQVDLIISQLPETISVPCNARLVGSLTATTSSGGILIASDGVTLDLGGHGITGVGTSGSGISVQGSNRRGIIVRNGSVRNFTSGGVILANASSPQVQNIHATGNTAFGISTSGGQIVDCVSNNNAGVGIYAGDDALVSRCTANFNTGNNIEVNLQSTVQDCVANNSTGGHGIRAFLRNTISNCTANNNALSGIRAEQRTRVSECTLYSNIQNGVHITAAGTVERCTIGRFNLDPGGLNGILMDVAGAVTIRDNVISEYQNNGSVGIKILNAGFCRVENNQISVCWRSIEVSSGANFITGNSSVFVGAGGHYSIVAGNSFGPIVVVNNVGDISGTANSNHPQANFTY